jgi:hypothetical protein
VLAFLVALLIELGAPPAVAPEYAVLLHKEAQAYKVPAEVVAALCAHESRWDRRARGALGEIGLCQLYRGTLATRGFDRLTNRQLENPKVQFHLAARHLSYLRSVCGRVHRTHAKQWISPYSGRKCTESVYSDAIVGELEAAKQRVLSKHGPVLTTHVVGFTAITKLAMAAVVEPATVAEPLCLTGPPLWCPNIAAPIGK